MWRLSVHKKATLLRDAVLAASDGVVTTFAVVAGSTGASLSTRVVIILGVANLLADGFSMAAGNYLGTKSEVEYEEAEGEKESEVPALRQGIVVFVSFIVAGFLPLFSYIINLEPKFEWSVVLVAVSLFLIGSFRSRYTKKSWVRSGLEMLLVGGFAAFVAFMTGELLKRYVL